ncbi:MAG: hypothetical protein IJI05_05150, partial [Erysipelotrichaceae bacterium]|nr:hypothetical protein [Erysipelotrichaceae bacterium]
KEIIGMLCSDEQLERRWRWFTGLHEVQVTHDDPCDPSWLRIPVKKRFVDPLIKDRGRTSELFPEYRARLRQFIDLDLNYWVRGISYRE